LKMIDLDGSSTLSKVISMSFEKGGAFVIVENPASNGTFKLNTNLKNPQITLLGTLGQRIALTITADGKNNYILTTPNAVTGIYYLTILSDNKVTTRKVLFP
jgi:hypothetical protein